VTLDGNSVDLDHEKVTAADNAVQYEAATTFASQTVRMMMIAITGSASQQSSGG
jgi:flagellar basal body rod protein FlgB